MKKTTKIGITSGDLNGVGLQVLIESLDKIFQKNKNVILILFGSKSSWEFYLQYLKKTNIKFNLIDDVGDAKKGLLNIIECVQSDLIISPGKITKDGALGAGQSLSEASDYLVSKKIDALVTMPVNKSNIFLNSKTKFLGHTEYLREKSQAKETLMILLSQELKVAIITNHIPISLISKTINKKLITSKINILLNSLKNDFLIKSPKIAVLGLNPHMGDSGLIGMEEIKIIKPVIKRFSDKGFNVSGPFSSDAFFGKSSYNDYDAVLAMYHDQGLIPFKMKSFNQGLNYTAGMNFIRTSPDHGPAYDIVGSEKVNCKSFFNAIFFAEQIYHSRLV
mgnify:FL=1